MAGDTTTQVVPLRLITVGERSRKDLGDLSDLVESIGELGLLHPIVLTESYELVAGERRLESVRQLEWESVTATVLSMGADEMLRAERDENSARLDLRRSEMVALGRRLEARLKAKVKEQQRQQLRRVSATRPVEPDEIPSSTPVGDVRLQVGKSLGIAGSTYDRAKRVVEAAEEDPGEYADLVEKMDETGNVGAAYRELKERQQGDEPAPKRARASSTEIRAEQIRSLASEGHDAEQIAGKLGVTREYIMRLATDYDIDLVEHRLGKQRRIDPNHVMEETVRGLEVTATTIEIIEGRFDELDPEQIDYWSKSIVKSLGSLKRLSRKLKEAASVTADSH